MNKYKLKALRPALKFGPIGRPTGGEAAAKARSAAAEGWTAVAEGQTKALKAPQGRANSELRNSPTQP
ncbi:hypothetical protein SGRA_0071 [Saprospira grandis str. Lewin]|uniref:Uncharacterized protein n=1 Tax=Saprospira grandis (strain Lewin) TaxID=984262 RepID=H6L4D7_SAPGL|nr:hypothetical protein SGRA_0071 [Saprospira grandis str. Lewin]